MITTTTDTLSGEWLEQPRYLVVARRVATAISGGQLRRGDRLPGERELCRIFDVSRVTVRRALEELRNQALVEPVGARGWFVTSRLLGEPSMLVSFSDMAAARGLDTSSTVLSSTVRRPDLEEATALAVPSGGTVLDLERLRKLSGVPVAIERSRLALFLVPVLSETDFGRESVYETLRRCGVVPTRADYELQAVAADDAQATLLEIEAGAPLQAMVATTFDQHGRAIELSNNVFRGDSYRFSTRLFAPPLPDSASRAGTDGAPGEHVGRPASRPASRR